MKVGDLVRNKLNRHLFPLGVVLEVLSHTDGITRGKVFWGPASITYEPLVCLEVINESR